MLFFDDAAEKNLYIVVQVYPEKKHLIYWKYKPTNDDLSEHSIKIYRKLYDAQEFELVATISANSTQYLDDFYIHSHYKDPKYCLQIDDGEKSKPVSVQNHPSPETIAIRRQINIHIRYSGVPTLIYARHHEGERCTACWDPIRKQIKRSDCPDCFNTGYIGGFYPPILTQVQFISPRKTNQPGETLREKQKTVATMAFYPVVNPRDVLFNIHKGTYWRVDTVDPSEDGSALLHQDMSLDRLNPGDIERDLKFPEKLVPVIPPRKIPFGFAIDVTKGVSNA